MELYNKLELTNHSLCISSNIFNYTICYWAHLVDPIGGKSSGSSIFNLGCVTNGDSLSLSFPWTLGDFLLKRGDEEGDDWCSCSFSLRLCERGVTGDGEGVFCEGNIFPLDEFFVPCCVWTDIELAPLACETGVFLGVTAALCLGVKWWDVFSLR